ncbi:hypothetical protein CF335_g9488, partial [Tilletia laevis]
VRSAAPGSFAAMADAQEAFRAISARKDQWPGLVIALPLGGFGIDTRLPFGLASATGVWGTVADLVKVMLVHQVAGLRVIKWVDDFIFVKPPSSDVELKDIHAATECLGFPWHPSKFSEFGPKVTYLGFEWDLHKMTVKLPDDKRDAFRQRVAAFRHSDVKSLKEVREVCGSLQHITMMARDLAPYLSEFYNFLAAWSAKSQYQKLYVPVPVQDEAKVWFKALQNEMIRTTRMPKNVFPLTLYVDASTEWGIGLTCEGKWAAWMLLAGWDTNGRGIGWAEAAALELGVRQAVELGASNCVLNIFSDNKGVIGAFKRGRSRGRSSNSIMRTLIAFQMEHQLDVRVEYVSTHVNPADAPSRGTMSPPTLHPCGSARLSGSRRTVVGRTRLGSKRWSGRGLRGALAPFRL